MNDSFYMQRVFELAAKGKGAVSPNPLVGCVIVKNDVIIGQGYHRQFGTEHAEINALNNCTEDPTGADLYINLEPCSHYGKTPPCAPRIISAGIKRVFCSISDPNPLVSFKGIQLLRNSGVEVFLGLEEHKATELNKFFLKFISRKKPFVTVKLAQSIDGRIADASGSSRWITGEISRRYVHSLRAEYDAVAVGARTVRADNPELTVRLVPGRNPMRIIFTQSGNIPTDLKIVTNDAEKTIIFCAEEGASVLSENLLNSSPQLVFLPSTDLFFHSALEKLAEMGIASVLLEGGARLAGEFLKNGLADRLLLFTANKVIGDGLSSVQIQNARLSEAMEYHLLSVQTMGEDIVSEYQPRFIN